VRLAVPLLVAAALVVAACDDDSGGDAETFCSDVAENVEALRAVPATEDGVEELIDLWRDVGDAAPLAIEAEWDTLTENLERAWTSEDRQEVLAGAFAAEQSAVAVAAWLDDTCGIDFGPVVTIVPAAPATSTSTSSTTTAPG
jgi:hypothetical protein